MDSPRQGSLDPTTRATFKSLQIRRLTDQFVLKRLGKERRALNANEQAARKRLAEIDARINRELDANPQLRGRFEEE